MEDEEPQKSYMSVAEMKHREKERLKEIDTDEYSKLCKIKQDKKYPDAQTPLTKQDESLSKEGEALTSKEEKK